MPQIGCCNYNDREEAITLETIKGKEITRA